MEDVITVLMFVQCVYLKAEHSYGDDDNNANSNTDDEYDEIDNFKLSPTSSPVHSTSVRPVIVTLSIFGFLSKLRF